MADAERRAKYLSPLRLLVTLLVSIFATEFGIMAVLDSVPMLSMHGWGEAAVDAGVLCALLFPLVFFLVYRPMKCYIGELEQTGTGLLAIHDRLELRVRERTVELEQCNHEMTTLAKMSRFLQACASLEEVYDVIARTGQRLFPGATGALFVYSASRDDLECVVSWGEITLSPDERVFAPDECWGLRCGRVSFFDDDSTCLSCRHVKSPLAGAYLCLPMTAQGEVLGVVHLRPASALADAADDHAPLNKRVAVTLAEHVALALTNLRLRERLRNQSIRDPLTGLFNRRYLEESLERDIYRAKRGQHPLAVVMLDLDHFKQFNDTYGHEAGDLLLRELGTLLNSKFRGSDVASRYGGEEFTLAMPDISEDAARERIELLLRGIRDLKAQHRGQLLRKVTASAGIAMYPQHGETAESLLRAADRALYHAKSEGRDRVVVAQTSVACLESSNPVDGEGIPEAAPAQWPAATASTVA